MVNTTREMASTAAWISAGPFLSRAARHWRSRPDSRRHEVSTTPGTTPWDPRCSATNSPVLGAAASTTRGRFSSPTCFSQPVFSDWVAAGISGLLSRRIQVQTAVGGSRGDVGFSSGGNGFWNYYATASSAVALNQFVAFNLTYTYYRYRYQDGVVLPAGLPNFADREGIMAYVTLWAPIVQRGRRSNASR